MEPKHSNHASYCTVNPVHCSRPTHSQFHEHISTKYGQTSLFSLWDDAISIHLTKSNVVSGYPTYPNSMYNPMPSVPSQYPPTYGSMSNLPPQVKQEPIDLSSNQRHNILQKKAMVNKECYDEALNYLNKLSHLESSFLASNNSLNQGSQKLREEYVMLYVGAIV